MPADYMELSAGSVCIASASKPTNDTTVRLSLCRRPADPLELEWKNAEVFMDEAFDDPECTAVCICTENPLHELMVQQGLSAGKHVCVEYPIALDLRSAHALFELADKNKLVLHVEHIELMSGPYRALREQVLNHSHPCLRAELGFCGPLLPAGSGWIAHAGIARLHRIRDLFGEDLQIRDFVFLEGLGAAADKSVPQAERSNSLSVTFRNSAGTDVLWTEWRSPGLGRTNTIDFMFTDKSHISEMPKVPNSVPLFLGDLEIFLQKVRFHSRIVDCFHSFRDQVARQRDRREYRDAIMWCLAMASLLQAIAIKYRTWHWTDRQQKPIPTTTEALAIIDASSE